MNCDGKVRFVVFEKATFSKLVAPKSHNENLSKREKREGPAAVGNHQGMQASTSVSACGLVGRWNKKPDEEQLLKYSIAETLVLSGTHRYSS